MSDQWANWTRGNPALVGLDVEHAADPADRLSSRSGMETTPRGKNGAPEGEDVTPTRVSPPAFPGVWKTVGLEILGGI